MNLQSMVKNFGKNLKEMIQKINDKVSLQDLAKKTGFVRRCTSRLRGEEFIKACLIESTHSPRSSLSAMINTAQEINPEACMSVQGFRKRLNSRQALAFVQALFEKSFEIVLAQNQSLCEIPEPTLLSAFRNVYIEDSTECPLAPELENTFKGSGGGNGNGKGNSSVKIDCVFEYHRKFFSSFKITDRMEPDAILGRRILSILKKDDLVIRDLGYSNLEVFDEISKAEAYYLSRLFGCTKVYLSQEDKEAVDLGDYLLKKSRKCGYIDVDVHIGKNKLLTRLIAYKVPQDIERKRKRDHYALCRKKKREPSKDIVKRLSFTIFITNVSREIWSPEVVGTIYRVRWQIETIIKTWKSNLGFDHLQGTNSFRIQVLIYARLIGILIMFTIYGHLDRLALVWHKRETSIYKVIETLKQNGRFAEIIKKGLKAKLWEIFCEGVKNLCKNKRKRKTTYELLKESANFYCFGGAA